ncbi:glycosyltransferase family 4 protein [Bacillus luti]|uniref:glycosyltransferase family 4 protein n=1 Tax=Bacillus luti TaxID=2026191 RepID=UPI0012E939FE|nr:glycosyltransferase family 4 protein [Bacillus luti]
MFDKNKPRIAFFIGSMRRGGAERVISILANTYAEKGWEVDILTLLDDANEYNLHESINVKPIGTKGNSRIRKLPSWITSIRKYVVENKPDRVVSFIARINIIVILACMGLNQRIIVSERNDPKADGRSKLVEMATSILYPLVDKVVFQTKWAKSCFSTKIQRNSVIIPNPISVNIKASNKKQKMIVAVGRLLEQKNHELLIRSFGKMKADFPEYSLYIYGEGALRDKLTKLIEELKLTKSVFLPGNISNIHERIVDAEMFVLSSNYEGLSNALLEAMVIGLPCISTDCAGSNEVIEHEKNGLIVPIGSEEDLIKAMKLLAANSEIRDKISKGAKKTSENFDVNVVVDQWISIIEA